ncbi:MAG: exodeoxyribonuclease VII large subunit [Alphaproteobacteria bacterium]
MLFDEPDARNTQSNVPEFSVSELAFSVKRTVEEHYGRIRVRGEISRVSIPRSGHMYTSLKDDKAVIDAVCWKGVLSKLSIRPEEGLDVICTGKMTTYPGNSRYQLVIESMELAGEGALLKMLEERKKKLTAEGLFDTHHKKELPFLPERIGVITSPTGAVIRDILHRLSDRFPRNVILWPVKVQGQGADIEITKAINGLNTLKPPLRPDIIIIARGGGSLEDLMPFNEEMVVRAAFQSTIPIISAIGHETDTTLLDFVADKRAPTPTGAAEMAVPVRATLRTQILDNEKRLINAMSRNARQNRHKIEAISAKLGDPARLLELKTQHLDRKSDRLDHGIKTRINQATQDLIKIDARLTHPARIIEKKGFMLDSLTQRTQSAYTHYLTNKAHILERTTARLRTPQDRIRSEKRNIINLNRHLERTGQEVLTVARNRLTHLTEKLELLSFENVLARGYIVIRGKNNNVITQPDTLKQEQEIKLQFKNKTFIDAKISDQGTHRKNEKQEPQKRSKPKTKGIQPKQRDLF